MSLLGHAGGWQRKSVWAKKKTQNDVIDFFSYYEDPVSWLWALWSWKSLGWFRRSWDSPRRQSMARSLATTGFSRCSFAPPTIEVGDQVLNRCILLIKIRWVWESIFSPDKEAWFALQAFKKWCWVRWALYVGVVGLRKALPFLSVSTSLCLRGFLQGKKEGNHRLLQIPFWEDRVESKSRIELSCRSIRIWLWCVKMVWQERQSRWPLERNASLQRRVFTGKWICK